VSGRTRLVYPKKRYNVAGLSQNFTWDFSKTHGWTSNSKNWFSGRFGPFRRLGPVMDVWARVSLATTRNKSGWDGNWFVRHENVDSQPCKLVGSGRDVFGPYRSTYASPIYTKLGVGFVKEENDWHSRDHISVGLCWCGPWSGRHLTVCSVVVVAAGVGTSLGETRHPPSV